MQDFDPVETEEEYQERRSELIEEAKESKQELEEEQREILEEISSEHGGELVETKANIAGDYVATVKVRLNGKFINRLGAIEEAIDNPEESVRDIETVMDEASQLLADIIEEREYDKSLFYGVYEENGPIALGNIIESVFNSIEEEQKRKQGAVSGFRQE